MMKKTILLLIVFSLAVSLSVYANNDEYEVMDFSDGSRASDRFNSSHNDVWFDTQGLMQIIYYDGSYINSRNNNDTLYNTININDAVNKSDKYVLFHDITVNERDNNMTSAFYIGSLTNNISSSEIVITQSKKWIDVVIGSSVYRFKEPTNSKYYTLNYEVIFRRIGDGNTFDVDLIVKRNGSKFQKVSGRTTLDKMVVGFGSTNRKWNFVKYFEARRLKPVAEYVEVNDFYQDGNALKLNASYNTAKYEGVIIEFSESASFSSKTQLYKGALTSTTKEIILSDAQRKDGYLRLTPYKDDQVGLSKDYEFKFLKPVSSFGYINTGQSEGGRPKYKFFWENVAHASGYDVFDDGAWLDTPNNTFYFATYNPENLSIKAYRQGIVGSEESKSLAFDVVLGNLGSVKNLNANKLQNNISFTWDLFPDANKYAIYRKDHGTSSFALVSDSITVNNYNMPYSTNSVSADYKVVAFVGNISSRDSNHVTVDNKVTGVGHTFDDETGKVKLNWTEIKDADSYKFFVSGNASMTGANEYSVTNNAGQFDFVSNDTNDKYVQILAIKGAKSSSKSNVYEIDFARNNPVQNVALNYAANSNVVKITWDALTGANQYKVFIGDSANNLSMMQATGSTSYDYIVQGDDPNMIYVSIQGIGSSVDFVKSPVKSVATFSNDKVENISMSINVPNGDHSQTKADLHWSELFRADKYVVEYDFDSNIDDTTYSPIEVTKNKVSQVVGSLLGGKKVYFRVKGLYGSVSSKYSNVVNSGDVGKVAITTSDDDSLTNKNYGTPIEFDLDFQINETGLKNTQIEISFDSILEPGLPSNVIASYVYPQIMSVKLSDGADLTYKSSIATGRKINNVFYPDAGFKVLIEVTDPNEVTKLVNGKTLTVRLKTDLRFKTDGSVSAGHILYKSGGNLKVMELPFNIENQIISLQNHYGKGTFIKDNTSFDVLMSYETPSSAGSRFAKYYPISFDFKSKNAIIGE